MPNYDYLLDCDDEGEFCVIPLGGRGNFFAKIDPEDFEDISRSFWFPLYIGGKAKYARTNIPGKDGGKRKTELLHRRVLKVKNGVSIDHKNGDGLDCRKQNLRVATTAENIRNMKPRTGGTSKYKGVSWKASKKKWVAQIAYNGKRIHISYFDSEIIDGIDTGEIKAARAYDDAAIKYFGSFACLNFPAERNIITLKDGAYKMSHIMSEQDKKNIEKKIKDLKEHSRGEIFTILEMRGLQEIINMCHYFGCGIGELVSEIRKGIIPSRTVLRRRWRTCWGLSLCRKKAKRKSKVRQR